MNKSLEAAANALSAAAEQLRALAQSSKPFSVIDPENMSAEDRDQIKDLVNVWLGYEWDKKFEGMDSQLQNVDVLINDLREEFEGEISSIRSDLPEDLDDDVVEKLRYLAKFFESKDPNDIVVRDEISDFYKKSDFDIDDYPTKSEIPDFDEYDFDEMDAGAKNGTQALDDIEALATRVCDLESGTAELACVVDLLEALGLDIEALTKALTSAKNTGLEIVSG